MKFVRCLFLLLVPLSSLACSFADVTNVFLPSPTASARMAALVEGQLELVGTCVRVRTDAENYLVVFPADFQTTIANNQLTVQDVPLNKTHVWTFGNRVQFAGGEAPNLTNELRARVPPECLGPYWIFGGWL